MSAASILCGASLARGWNVQVILTPFVLALLNKSSVREKYIISCVLSL